MGYEAAELEQREVGDLILIPEKNVQLKVVGHSEQNRHPGRWNDFCAARHPPENFR